jgi:hypothetical protein
MNIIKILLGTAIVAVGSYLLLREPAAPLPVPAVETARKAPPALKSAKPKLSDEELFEMLFGKDSDKPSSARRAVDEYMAKHPGKTMRELALDPAISGQMATLMIQMAQRPDDFKGLAEAANFAMQMKGMKPGPDTRVNINLADLAQTESQAERFLGAVLTKDARALSDLFSDISPPCNPSKHESHLDEDRNNAASRSGRQMRCRDVLAGSLEMPSAVRYVASPEKNNEAGPPGCLLPCLS